MYKTSPACVIDLAARHTRGFRRFDADLGGECGHLLINKEILSNSPFGRTTQTVVAFQRQHKGPSTRFEILKKQQETGPPGTHSLNALLLMRALAKASFVTAKGT
jgi:hypothetical protein